jgi:hypothetical protein
MNRITINGIPLDPDLDPQAMTRLLSTDASHSTPPPSHGTPLIAVAPPTRGDGESNWIRLGSVLTDHQGTFVLTLNDDNKTGTREQQPDLMLVVSPPEESCTQDGTVHARLATCMRPRAGSVESFLIFWEEAQLANAGIPIPAVEMDVEDLIKQQRLAAERQKKPKRCPFPHYQKRNCLRSMSSHENSRLFPPGSGYFLLSKTACVLLVCPL